MLGAVKLFELGKLSSGRAAQLAGVSRAEFLLAKVPAGDSSIIEMIQAKMTQALQGAGLWLSEELVSVILRKSEEGGLL